MAREGCPELTPDLPRVEETHKSHTRGSFIFAKRRVENDQWLQSAELDNNLGKCIH